MGLTLGNAQTLSTSSVVNYSIGRSKDLATSMSTGMDQNATVVNKFLGYAMSDTEVVLGAIAANTAYGTNLLNITNSYLDTISDTLLEAQRTVASAGPLSADKLATLQTAINNKVAQINTIISTANFDGKDLFGGAASSIDIKVGIAAADTINVSVSDFSNGKLFRSTLANALNNVIATKTTSDAVASGYTVYYATAAALKTAINANENLVHTAYTAGANPMTDALLGAAIVDARTADSAVINDLKLALPLFTAQLAAIAPANTIDWSNATGANIVTALGNAPAKAELVAFLKDNAAMDITTSSTTRVVAANVLSGALQTVRIEQASIGNEINNVEAASDALRKTTDITKTTADSYLKTDYVLAAQDFSETLKQMTAAIASLQATNKLGEAAQSLVQSLTR